MYNGTYQFWLLDETNGINFKFPVVPASFEVPDGNKIETLTTTEYGDLTIVGFRKTKDIKIEGFFPANEYEFAPESTDDADPMKTVDMFVRWVKDKTVLRLIIANDVSTKLNARFVIEDFIYKSDREANRDINFTLTLKEFTPIKTPTVNSDLINPNSSEQNKERNDGDKKTVGKEYTVVQGDCLYNISRAMYGDPEKWTTIYEANKDVIGSNPNMIFPGQKLTIP